MATVKHRAVEEITLYASHFRALEQHISSPSLCLCEARIGSSVSPAVKCGLTENFPLHNTHQPFLTRFQPQLNSPSFSVLFAPFYLPAFFIIVILDLSPFCSLTPRCNIRHKEAQTERVFFFLSVTAFGPMACHFRSLLIGVARCQGTGAAEDVTEICLHTQDKSVCKRHMEQNNPLSGDIIWTFFTVDLPR